MRKRNKVIHLFAWFILALAKRTLLEWVELSIIKPKPKQLLCPITTDLNSAMNQSEHETDRCNRCKARENTCEQIMIGWIFTSNWLTGQEKGANFLNESQSVW